MRLKEALAEFLTPAEMRDAVTSFDIVGKIAVIEIPENLRKHEKRIGAALLRLHPNLRTICCRAGKHTGKFRIRPVKVIAGEKNFETEYIESGARMFLDISKVYFTPRLSHERERIAAQVKPGERIAAFFAGVGPFALVIAKKCPAVKITAVELNPDAYKYLETNIRINGFQTIIKPVLGDVGKVKGKFDRVLMPLPKGAEDFLGAAFRCAAPGCVVHFYQFAERDNPFTKAVELIKSEAAKHDRKIRILKKHIVRPFSPAIVQIVVDFRVV